ncbi:MAG: DUF1998 domain-containing protein [Chamaesiphon sp.]|nr:DUF1998 domain-containing protein [Chamaesiphon sp.]
MKSKQKRPPDGEIRQSQLLSSFGPGSMVDLPEASVLIGGLNYWKFDPQQKREIVEERLSTKICEKLRHRYPELGSVKLYEPPTSNRDSNSGNVGVKAFQFPIWFVAQTEETWTSPTRKVYRTRPLVPFAQLTSGSYFSESRKKIPVVPVRFVQACPNGHISDIDWSNFARHKDGCQDRYSLYLDEGGSSSDFADIFVRCQTCNERRPFSEARLPSAIALGSCQGKRPWLGPNNREDCINPENNLPYPNRLLVRAASNAYFPQIITVISLPDSNQNLRDTVNEFYDGYLSTIDNLPTFKIIRQLPAIAEALRGFSDESIFAEIQRRRSGVPTSEKLIKEVEIETLLSQAAEIGNDTPESDFYACNRPLTELLPTLKERIDRIVLVHRRREVVAQVGFTRFEPSYADIDGELNLNVQSAALAAEPRWFPAIENKGEGVFISFNPTAIDTWKETEAVKQRGRELLNGHQTWLARTGRKAEDFPFPGLPYVMLHSLSHLLITTVSLECGYSASAIKERVYASDKYGYGILLYTGSAGSEGTLGGLVQVGKRIESILANALEFGRLCSNDPVCAQHKPAEANEERFLHGAACHGCLLIAETSCEKGNEFLDRALVVNTVENQGAAFFPDFL